MSSYLSSFLSSAFGTGAAFDSSDESDGENQSPANATAKPKSSSSSSSAATATNKPGTSTTEAESSSVHWLGVETDEKEVRVVCDQRAAKEVLCKCSDTTPLNLISIFGAARQGKSFLMNMLAGEDRLFKISSSQDPCTQGVDLSRKVVSWGAFHRHDEIAMKKHERKSLTHASSEPAPKIAFVDVEGQGDRDLTYDANLVCPVVLTSRCVIFNWKDSLQRDRLLNLLAVMQRAAFNVATDEEDGKEGTSSSSEQPKIFGHLHIVFRDWAYDGTKETVYKTLFTQERSLAPDAVARNQIRSVLENAFESIAIWLLPPPVERTTDLNKELRENDLSDAFKNQVTALRHALAEQVKTPHHFCGKVLTGPKIASLVPALVQTLNDGNQVLPRSAYANLIAAEVTRVQASYLKRLQKALAAVKQQATSTPLTTGELQARVVGEVHRLQRDFDHWLHSLGDAATAKEAAEAFQEHCSKGTEEVVAFNREHLLVAHLHAAGKQAQVNFDASFTNTIEARLPMAPEKLVACQQAALGKAEGGVRGVVGGEVDLTGLPLDDVLASLRTHAALALTKVEERNKQQLARVQQQEQTAFEHAKAQFQENFFSALFSLKATGGSISESEFGRVYDSALMSAMTTLAGGMHAELTSVGRREELKAFLVCVCEGMKGEQGAMYQLGTTKALLAKAKEEAEERVRRVEARGEEEKTKLRNDLQEAWREVERLQDGGMAERALEARVADLEATVERLEEDKEGLRKESALLESQFLQACEAQAKLEREKAALLKSNTSLTAECDRLVQEQQRMAGEKETLQQRVEEAGKKRKAAEEEAERAVKARREADAEAAAAQAAAAAATSAATAGAAAAAFAAKEEEEEEDEEEEEGQGMDVEDNTSVKEEEAQDKKKKKAPAPAAAKPKGRTTAAKGRASSSKPALSPAAQRKLVEEAREEERKRIEESTAKRVTRTRK